MKKVLVLLTLALVLCLAYSVASAEIVYQIKDGVEHQYDISGENIGFMLPHEENGRVVNGYIRFKCIVHNDEAAVNDFKDFPILASSPVFYTYDEVKANLDDTTKVKAYQLPECSPATDGWVEVYVNEAASQQQPTRIAGEQKWSGWEGPRSGSKKLTKADSIFLTGGHLASNVERYYITYGYAVPQYTDGSKIATCSEEGELNVYCLRCKAGLETIILQKNPFNHTSPVTIDEPATCSSGAHFRYYCEACGKDIDPDNQPETFGEPLNPDDPDTVHSDPGFYEDIYSKNDPRNKDNICDKDDDETKTQNEVRIYFKLCADCNYRVETVVETPWHHTWGEWEYVTKPTCTEDGTLKRTCEGCGKVQNYPGYEPEDAAEQAKLDMMIASEASLHPIYEVICEGFVNTDDLQDPWDDAQVTAAELKAEAEWSCALRELNADYELVNENQDYYFIYRCSKCHKIARVAVKTAPEHQEKEQHRSGTCEDSIIKEDPNRAYDWTRVVCKVCGEQLAAAVKGEKKAHTVPEGTWVKTVDGGEGKASNWMGICEVCGDVVNLVTYGNPNDSSQVLPSDPGEDPADPESVPAKDKYAITSESLEADLAVITYEPVAGNTINNLRIQLYFLGYGTTYVGVQHGISSNGDTLQYPLTGVWTFLYTIYDADTGEEVASGRGGPFGE